MNRQILMGIAVVIMAFTLPTPLDAIQCIAGALLLALGLIKLIHPTNSDKEKGDE